MEVDIGAYPEVLGGEAFSLEQSFSIFCLFSNDSKLKLNRKQCSPYLIERMLLGLLFFGGSIGRCFYSRLWCRISLYAQII